MNPVESWWMGLDVAVTVTDENGKIIGINAKANDTFMPDGTPLLGADVFACHPEPSRSMLRKMYVDQKANHYTVRKKGQRKIIHQMPWKRDGKFAGYVEISVPIADELPHKERG